MINPVGGKNVGKVFKDIVSPAAGAVSGATGAASNILSMMQGPPKQQAGLLHAQAPSSGSQLLPSLPPQVPVPIENIAPQPLPQPTIQDFLKFV